MGLFENSFWFLQRKVGRLPFFYFMFADPLLFLYDLCHPTMCDLELFQEYRELHSGQAWKGEGAAKVQGWNQSMDLSFLTRYAKPQRVHANHYASLLNIFLLQLDEDNRLFRVTNSLETWSLDWFNTASQ